MKKVTKIIFFLFILFCSFLNNHTYGALSLSITPYEGGTDLRFGNVNSSNITRIDKEVNVRITATENKQYRIYQSLLDPLTNEKGERLPQENLVFNALLGKNQYGTVHALQEQPVGLSRTLIYTSNTAGLSDSLVLAYGIKLGSNVKPGYYSGRLAFILEPINATVSVAPQILNIYVQIESKAIISVQSASGSQVISLNSEKEIARSQDVIIEVKSDIGSPYRIYHWLSSTFVSEKGQQLPPGAITFAVSQADKGKKNTSETDLSLIKQLLYTSNQKGEKDTIVLTYKIGDLSKVIAGTYRGTLQYLFETADGEKNSIIGTFGIELINEEVFNIVVTLGPTGRISFEDLKPLSKPKQSEVVIDIKTNVGQPYQVIQTVYSELVSKTGEKIPPKYFTLKTESMDGNELPGLKFPTPAEVKTKDTVVYASDKKGSPVSFKVIYELNVADTVKADDYSTNIVYSLLKIH